MLLDRALYQKNPYHCIKELVQESGCYREFIVHEEKVVQRSPPFIALLTIHLIEQNAEECKYCSKDVEDTPFA